MTIKDVHYFSATAEGQREASDFVRREVVLCVSSFIDNLAKSEKAQQGLEVEFEDLMSILSRPDYSEPPEGYYVGRLSEGGWYWMQGHDGESHDEESEEEAIKAAWDDSREEPERNEAYEHWVVSNWLADKLEEHGEMIAEDIAGIGPIWGRTTSGQSIASDFVICAILAEMNK